jgi:hypothetical protein
MFNTAFSCGNVAHKLCLCGYISFITCTHKVLNVSKIIYHQKLLAFYPLFLLHILHNLFNQNISVIFIFKHIFHRAY